MGRFIIKGKEFDADLVVFDKDGLLFDNFTLLKEICRVRTLAMLPYANAAFLKMWMSVMGAKLSFLSDGTPQITDVNIDGAVCVAPVTDEVLISATLFMEHLGMRWTEAKTLAQTVHGWADEHFDYTKGILPHKGFPEIFHRLSAKGIPYGVITMDERNRALRSIAMFCDVQSLSFLISALEADRPKPAPDALLDVSRRMNVPPQKVLMIGDLPLDMQMARAAQAIGVGIPEYASSQDAMREYADVLCESLDDIQIAF